MASDQAELMSPRDLLEAHSHFWHQTFSFVRSMSLKCAIELGIPDAIHNHNKPITLSQLASALSIPPSKAPSLGRLMRLLVHNGIFSSPEPDVYALNNNSEILIKQKSATYMSPIALGVLHDASQKPWQSLSSWFVSSEHPTAWEMTYGKELWQAMSETPELNRMMNEATSSDSMFINQVIVREYGAVIFEGVRSLVDVAGGVGTLARAVNAAFPDVKCTVLDLPHVVEGLEGSEGVRFVAGDMFEYVPPAQVALIKWVLHDWGDEECVKILKRCKESIPVKEDGGKVIIIDMVVKTENLKHDLVETQFTFDLFMMLITTGKERTENEWKKIFIEAGFTSFKFIPTPGLRSIIEVYH